MGAHVHTLIELNRETGAATCRNCGPVQARWVANKNGFRCPVGYAKNKKGDPAKHQARTAAWRRKKRSTFLPDGALNCQICKVELTRSTACIDHDHRCCSCGTICPECFRGILCYNCNVGLGHFQDDRERLQAAITYLETNEPAKFRGA